MGAQQAALFVGKRESGIVEQHDARIGPQASERAVVVAQVVGAIERGAAGVGFDKGERTQASGDRGAGDADYRRCGGGLHHA